MTEQPVLWYGSAASADDAARAWLDSEPSPASIALLAGGPGRVADLVLAGLVASGRLSIGLGGPIRLRSDAALPASSLDAVVLDVVRNRQNCSVDDVRAAVARSGAVRSLWTGLRRAGLLTRRARYLAESRGPWSTIAVVGAGVLAYGVLTLLTLEVFAALHTSSASTAIVAGLICTALLIGGTAAVVLFANWLSEAVPSTRSPVRDPRTPAGHRALALLEEPDEGLLLGAPSSWASYRWSTVRGAVDARRAAGPAAGRRPDPIFDPDGHAPDGPARDDDGADLDLDMGYDAD